MNLTELSEVQGRPWEDVDVSSLAQTLPSDCADPGNSIEQRSFSRVHKVSRKQAVKSAQNNIFYSVAY